MSNFAELDSNNMVIRVLVGDDLDPAGDEGFRFISDTFSGTWVKTAYDGSIRKNYAGVGYTYDSTRDAFIAPTPYPSWVLNETTCRWQAPSVMPDDGKTYFWNESLPGWSVML